MAILSKVVNGLQQGDVAQCVQIMQGWLATAKPGDPEALLAAGPAEWRPKLALLLRDTLSRYPYTLLGAPVLAYCAATEGESPAAKPQWKVRLPYPTREMEQPCRDLHFMGWLPLGTRLPVELPFRPERYEAFAPMNEIFAAVALFRSHPEVFDLDQVELPNSWWGELFRPVAANVYLSARMLLPYPDALEAARVLSASARGEPPPARTGFLSDHAWAWARDAGALFQETCRHHC